MAPKFKFVEGEKVLCFHGPLIYEAKCVKTQAKDKAIEYYIHYSGWNKNWDEWVPESRVLKHNESNLMYQKEVAIAHGNKKNKVLKTGIKRESSDKESCKIAKAGVKRELPDRETSVLPPQEKIKVKKETSNIPSTSEEKVKGKKEATPVQLTSETSIEMQRKKRSKTEFHVETEEEFTQKLEIKVKIPDELKHWLVKELKLISIEKKLYKLPARVPVDNIISDYVKHRLSVKGITTNKESQILDVTKGIREYFNVMLGIQLLYPFEYAQHNEVMSKYPDLVPSQIYGAFHLLRLFTRIGGLLAYTTLDEDDITLLTNNMFEFLKYVSKCSATLLSLGDYESASPDYSKKNS